MAGMNDLISRKTSLQEEPDIDRLVFPINVHDSLQAQSGLKKGEKMGIILSFWLFGCGVLAWVLASWLRTIVPNYYIWIVIAVEVVLQLTVGMYILRFAMDERSVFAELKDSSKSFAQYFKIYREIKSTEHSKYPFDILEFDDGSFGVFIECRLGHNTQVRSNNTYTATQDITKILTKAGLPWKTFYHNESFKTSKAAQDLRDTLNGIKDPQLFGVYRDVVQNYLRIAEDESNVACVTYIVYAQTRIQKDEFVAIMTQVFATLQRDETVYRQITALKYEGIVEFLRLYYRLEVLDMGLIRATIAQKKNKFNCPVTVLKIYGKSGKIYVREDFKKLRDEILSDSGLTTDA